MFIRIGGPSNPKFDALGRFARRNGLTFLVPRRVVAELDEGSVGDRLRRACEEGWAERHCEGLEYSNPAVSDAMDIVTRYIVTRDDVRPDEVEKTDGALCGLAVQLLDHGADAVVIYTTDRLAGAGIEIATSRLGYDDRVTLVDANT